MLPEDYEERVYAGVLGKTIGVYLGRPFEGWPYEMIQKRLGDIEYYVHEKMNVPLVVTDDDIAGTFTFVRALADNDYDPDISAKAIGDAWLNYLIENKTILWWGGLGNSTEHTAFLRLKSGIEAPASGSANMNSVIISEQIGAQIFIDGWAMVSPGDAEQAAKLATRAASVSHDGEAIHGAVVLAVMEAMAFVESDMNKLLDYALGLIPTDSVIKKLIDDIRGWAVTESDWRAARERLAGIYGYDKFGGNCHMVPNHGLIILSLLFGQDDFSETMKIINTSGWDTDCNSGNVGCLMGIKNGLAGIDVSLDKGLDWRSPIADRIYVTAADPSYGISDCVRETQFIANTARRMNQLSPWQPKQGAQFHFEMPGSLQGFAVSSGEGLITNQTEVRNLGSRALKLESQGMTRFGTPVFAPTKEISDWADKPMNPYKLVASPRVYPGQTVTAHLLQGDGAEVSIYAAYYDQDDEVQVVRSESVSVSGAAGIDFVLPEEANPTFEIGIETTGTVYLDALTWRGEPEFSCERLRPNRHPQIMATRAWVNGVDEFVQAPWVSGYRLVQNRDRGLILQGNRDWRDVSVTADLTSDLAACMGVAVRAQGMRRYYALVMHKAGEVRLVKVVGDEDILASREFAWENGVSYELTVSVRGDQLTGYINGQRMLTARDNALDCGGMGLMIEEGCIASHKVSVASA